MEYDGAATYTVPLPIGVVVEDVAAVEYNGAAADPLPIGAVVEDTPGTLKVYYDVV